LSGAWLSLSSFRDVCFIEIAALFVERDFYGS
jgi:hypothetical protein